MVIKQIQLFDSVRAKHNLEVAQKAHDEQIGPALHPQDLTIDQLGVVDYLHHQMDRWEYIQKQEEELSRLIADGWTVIATYRLGDGINGCQLILYKPDTEYSQEPFEYSGKRGHFGIPVPDSDKAV